MLLLADPISGVADTFLGQGVLGAVAVMLIGAVVYQTRQLAEERKSNVIELEKVRKEAQAERETLRLQLVQSEQGRIAEAQSRVADAKEFRQFMSDFQKGETATVNALETVTDNLIRVTDDLRRVLK